MAGQADRYFSLQEICVLLNIAPKTFRQLLREYEPLLDWRPPEAPEPPRGLPAAVFERLRTVVELRTEGATDAEIRQALARPVPPPSPLKLPPQEGEERPAPAGGDMLDTLQAVRAELRRAEDQWKEEREKILTALIRVQQELQSLRYELVTQSSRRDRKRKAFWSSIF